VPSQSNHCRQTAAAAAGLSSHLLLGGESPKTPEGNFLLDTLLGATIWWTGTERKGEQLAILAQQLEQEGHRPYIIPYGGSNAVGATGFTYAVAELLDQFGNDQRPARRIWFLPAVPAALRRA
jgi:1-aminocyclopropane-1-carboxylate deaminase/D-cysteine desulfhydrase-like pyridoxal-dependent ACC family enzyme